MTHTDLSCQYFPVCPGCALQKQVASPPVASRLRETMRFNIVHDNVVGWRTRSKLAVRNQGQTGLFKRGSHHIIDIQHCPLHHEAIHQAIYWLKIKIQACGISSYDESTRRGVLRYVQFVVERRTGLVQLTLVVTEPQCLKNFISALWDQGVWHSIWVNIQPEPSNKIFGDRWILAVGKEFVMETLGGNVIAFHPACFGQANPFIFEKMLTSIREHILPEKKVLEYYAGVGVIGLSIAAKSKSVLMVEINPFSKKGFEHSTPHSNTYYIEADINNALHYLNEANVVMADPPRKGLPLNFIEALTASPVEQLIYMSCGPDSFQRDCALLFERGWQMAHLEGYLLFPGTDHLEMLGFFKRGK
ncbi:MAG: hypothetical protein A3E85_03230 [Gammaproteobacteria bacterium RIFCSPHIGHO2_12_FULL_45_12]|nr:MAG: hypothetical protein A3E85_03230 [Gammaproteobacteria bacterium RIFCSPHIGHO2_12_FULL_45_12]